MTMWIDDRGGSCKLLDYPIIQTIAEPAQGLSTDVVFAGNGPNDTSPLIGIECKNLWDLCSSMSTGRLQGTQLEPLLTYDQPWLLYWGDYRPGRDGSLRINSRKGWRQLRLGSRLIPFSWLEAFLVEAATVGVNIKHVPDESTAVLWLLIAYRWWNKPWTAHKGMRKFDNSREISLMPGMDDATLIRARIAAQLPGVGFERAVAAAVSFPSVAAMINGTVEDWLNVPGIGKVIARAIVEAVK